MPTTSENNKRIAKNTLLLYFRMFFMMVVSLYTSRVVLNVLGVEDYGIYNVVGGVVAMFSVLSGSLSSAISRFITYEIGKGEHEKLKKVFSSAVTVQLALGGIIVLVAETAGLWFLNTKMNIPAERMSAANWVLQFSVITFVINLVSVPYNAAIIAHERMSAFAYISILEVVGKLIIAYFITVSSIDKLTFYAILICLVAIIIRYIYGRYCRKHFEECTYHFILDKELLKNMFSFAGWNFFGNGAFLLNTQGVNVLMNIFFGVSVNAARGVASQVDAAMRQFINSFTTAVNPQIIKSYAIGDFSYMHSLVCRSAKFSSFLLIFFAVPIVLEANALFSFWLGDVPNDAVLFFQLGVMSTFVDGALANSLMTSMFATGNIKKYQMIVSSIGSMVFFLTWVFYYLGFNAYITYVIYFIIYSVILVVRLYLIKEAIHLPISMYVSKVIYRVVPVFVMSFMIPLLLLYILEPGLIRIVSVTMLSLLTTLFTAFIIGLTKGEKIFVLDKLKKILIGISPK